MLGRLASCLGLFSVVVNVQVLAATVQTHATELHCRAIDCMLARHHDRLPLLENPSLEACRSARHPRCLVSTRSKTAHRGSGGARRRRGLHRSPSTHPMIYRASNRTGSCS